MQRRYAIALACLLAAAALGPSLSGCEDDNPYFDSTNWNMNRTVEQLADILRSENAILLEKSPGSPLSESDRLELWALVLDECEFGFEIWVRLRRNHRLVRPFCETLSMDIVPLLAQRDSIELIKQESMPGLLSLIAPNNESFLEFRGRFNAYSAAALQDRCGSPSGYRQRSWP
ncbi:MAG: hypothetical protein P8M22_02645 [Phycisphaerales bacterium]|nr:hypothetical protein [Phycisphaerales bacterium]